VDLPTYTNIWRIEKRLYKLYDFRLPAPLPITWIAVFTGITVPYIFFLVVIGLPFNHNLVWLYVLPPGVLTWLTTRPVIESKRLPELVSSQLRYLSEPRTWCRMTPFAEKDDVYVTVRVWHRHPPGARPKKARKAAGRTRSAGRAPEDLDVAIWAPTSIAPDRALARDHVRGRVASALRHAFPVAWSPEDQKVIAQVRAAYDSYQHASAASKHRLLVTDRFVDLMALAGRPEEVREQVRGIIGVGGVGRIILLPQVPGQDFVEREEVLRLFAEQVMARL